MENIRLDIIKNNNIIGVSDLERCIICDLINHHLKDVTARIKELSQDNNKEYSKKVNQMIKDDLEDRKSMLIDLLKKLSTEDEQRLIRL